MERRTFLTGTAGLALSSLEAALPATIIDTHTHFWDTARPQGVPYPPATDSLLYRPMLPEEFAKVTRPLGVTGTIQIEASARLEDNQWALDLAAKNPVIVGFVGFLEPGKPDFRKNLSRFHRNRLFRGLRLGAHMDFTGRLSQADFIADLKVLAEAGLELDALGGPSVLSHLVRLTDQVSALRIVTNHLPFDPPPEAGTRDAYQSALKELGKRPQVYAKVSNVPRRVNERVPDEISFYRPALDEVWDVFGEDRLIYGSNWPGSAHVAPYGTAFKLVREYLAAKGQQATEKYFWKNSKAAYGWGA